jgi:hypothetical protein
MKFLPIRKPRTGVERLTALTRSNGLSRVEEKTIDCTYAFLGGGGCSIVTATPAAQLNVPISASPLALLYEYARCPTTRASCTESPTQWTSSALTYGRKLFDVKFKKAI